MATHEIGIICEKRIWDGEPGFVRLWDFSSANKDMALRIEAVSTVAGVCYGSKSKNNEALYRRLLIEHAGGPASSLEFVRDCFNPSIAGSLRNNLSMSTFCDRSDDEETVNALIDEVFKKVATFELRIPIFIARQLVRHRSFSFQEQSRRYQDQEDSPLLFWRGGKDNDMVGGVIDTAVDAYIRMLDLGFRKEEARAVLPVSLYTTIFVQGDAYALANYFSVRLDARTQKEHRDVSTAMFSSLSEYQGALLSGACEMIKERDEHREPS